MADEPKTPEELTPEEIAQRKAALEEFTQQREALEKEADDIIKEVEFDPVKNLRPATFALTKEESQELARAQEIYFKTLRRFSNISDEDARNVAVINEIRQTVSNALKSGAVDLEKLNAIYERAIKEHLYWSIFLSEIVIGSKSKGQPNADIYTIVSNFAPIDRKEIRMERGATQEVFDEQIAQLNIPDNVAFISDEDLYFLFTVPSLYKDTLDFAAPDQDPSHQQFLATKADRLLYPLDKVNSNVWNLLSATDADGQITIDFNTTRSGDKKNSAIVAYSLSFDGLIDSDNLKISKQLTPYDKRAFVACHSLYMAGNDCPSLTQIHRAMGNTTSPSQKQLEKLYNSIRKQGFARVILDNLQEVQAYKNYDRVKYEGPLLAYESLSGYVRGNLAETLIHIITEPILGRFARERNQITTIPPQLLESPINKTDKNLQIDDYLIERIGHMKNPHSKISKKITWEKLYDKCQITGKKEQQRAKPKVETYLTHYKKQAWIKDFTIDKTGITISLFD